MTNKIQQTQEALAKASVKAFEALGESLEALQAGDVIKPFRISRFRTSEDEKEMERLRQQGFSQRQISAKTGHSKSTVARGAKKANKSNGKVPQRGTPPQGDPSSEELAIKQFNFVADSVIETAGDALEYVKRMSLPPAGATKLIETVDLILSRWGEVKAAIKPEGDSNA